MQVVQPWSQLCVSSPQYSTYYVHKTYWSSASVLQASRMTEHHHHHHHQPQQQHQHSSSTAAAVMTVDTDCCQSQLIFAHLYHHQHHLVPLHRPRDPTSPPLLSRHVSPSCHVTSCRRVSGRLITCLATMFATPTTHQQGRSQRI